MAVDPEAVTAAQAVLADVQDEWAARSGVVAIEVARRWEGDTPTDEVCVRVTVERLLAPDQVPDGELFPSAVDGVRVQVREGPGSVPES